MVNFRPFLSNPTRGEVEIPAPIPAVEVPAVEVPAVEIPAVEIPAPQEEAAPKPQVVTVRKPRAKQQA